MAFTDYIFLFGETGKIAKQLNEDIETAKADDGKVDSKEAIGIGIKGLFSLFAILAPIFLKK